jgi:hypothetical protein
MSLLSKLESFVHTAEVKVSDVFVKIFGKDASQKFAQGALSLLKTAEGKIVLDAVQAVSTLETDGAGKRAAAFSRIGTDFKAQGISVGESVINMLVELAVQAIQGNFIPA